MRLPFFADFRGVNMDQQPGFCCFFFLPRMFCTLSARGSLLPATQRTSVGHVRCGGRARGGGCVCVCVCVCWCVCVCVCVSAYVCVCV